VFNLTTANLTTTLTRYVFQINASTINTTFIPIEFRGAAGDTGTNSWVLGKGDAASTTSYRSTDAGVTWTKGTLVGAEGLIVEYNQKSLASSLNEGVFEVVGREIYPVCAGENIVANWKIRQFTGESVAFTSVNGSCIVEYINDDLATRTTVSGATVNMSLITGNKEINAVWNNTDTALTGKVYVITCNINWSGTIGGVTMVNSFNSPKLFTFSRSCEIETNQTRTIVANGSITTVWGNVGGNVNGSVDSVTDPVTVGTNNDKTNYSLAGNQSINVSTYCTEVLTPVNVNNISINGTQAIFNKLNGSITANVDSSSVSTAVWDVPLYGTITGRQIMTAIYQVLIEVGNGFVRW
jgi:hypothetical protein